MTSEVSEIINAVAGLSNALKDNTGAEIVLYIVLAGMVLYAGYKIYQLHLDGKNESRTNQLLSTVDETLRDNLQVLGKVVGALERIEK